MICQVKPIKTVTSARTSIDKAFAIVPCSTQVETPVWSSPFTAGPYIVPITRWVE